ncbi:hypothetical protein F5Y15DRAFT_272688 [Xylariaceae sp. FL0016]|nr:hypothetical protein F5Y15DRAFT_272688 [Xylariaceae sp. FL0016]
MASTWRLFQSSTATKSIGGLAVAGIGGGLYYRYMMSVAQADSGAPAQAFGKAPAFQLLKLQSAEMVNHNTKRLRFELPEGDMVSGLGLSSALLTASWPKGCWLPALRPYTPITPLDERGHLDLLVKHYPNGKQSTHIHSLQPGESLRFVVQIPGYAWQRNKHAAVTLIAGGAGITPLYALAQGILSDPQDTTKVTLVYGANGDADVLLKDQFDAWEREHPGRFRAVYTVSAPDAGSAYRKGYVDKALLKEVAVAPGTENTQVLVCGPPAMEKALVGPSGILTELGYAKGQVYKF